MGPFVCFFELIGDGFFGEVSPFDVLVAVLGAGVLLARELGN